MMFTIYTVVYPGAVILVLVLTLVFCHAIILFTFGMSNLVFWILTCCQCPFPCQQYRGESRDSKGISKLHRILLFLPLMKSALFKVVQTSPQYP